MRDRMKSRDWFQNQLNGSVIYYKGKAERNRRCWLWKQRAENQ